MTLIVHYSQIYVYILVLESNSLINITNTPEMNEMPPSWSPKENIVLFTSTRTNSLPELSEKLILASEDGLCTMEIQNSHNIGSPSWSPDGIKIAFFGKEGVCYFDVSALENEFNLFRAKCNLTP